MFQVRSWENVILHLDGDAFFASVVQAVNPKLRGKPLITGGERGVATAISYEAKKLGIPRAMPIYQIRQKFPHVIVVDSDYELYELFSQKMFSILRSITPYVEEYSIDEAFADLKGLRRPLNLSYFGIAKKIKDKVENSLGITISVGVANTKSLAKLASSLVRPSGLTLISGRKIENLLAKKKVEEVWGIGENTGAYLKKLGIKTALEFANKDEGFIKSHLTKPFWEIWNELRGEKIYELDYNSRTTYKSITRSHTFHPPTNNFDLLWSRALSHVEEAFETSRRFGYSPGNILIFLKTQKFQYHKFNIKLLTKTLYPLLIRNELKKGFAKIYYPGVLYRSAGCTLSDLSEETTSQPTLFNQENKEEKMKKVYPLLEKGKVNFGSSLFEKRSYSKEKTKPKLSLPVLEI